VEDVIAPGARSHHLQFVRIDVLMLAQFVRLEMSSARGRDPSEFLGQHPLLYVLQVDAFTRQVGSCVHAFFAAIQVGMAGADAAESAGTHSAFVESRTVAVGCTRLLCVVEDRCVQRHAESEQKVTFQSISAAHVGLAVLRSDGFSVDQLDEEVDDGSVIPLGDGPVDTRSQCAAAQQTNKS